MQCSGMKRVAICLRGSVSRLKGNVYYSPQLFDITKQRELFYYGSKEHPEISYINLNVVYNSIKHHIVDANPEFSFDFFIHCWDVPLEGALTSLFSPKKAVFEDNLQYSSEILAKLQVPEQYSQASQLLSFKKVIELKEEYEREQGITYDLNILYRPDMMLWKDMMLNNYDPNFIYVNNWSESRGDFHFVASSENFKLFKNIYEYVTPSFKQLVHVIIRQYITEACGKPLLMDNIRAGFDQEVLRKIKFSLSNHSISIPLLCEYGLSEEELKEYQSLTFA